MPDLTVTARNVGGMLFATRVRGHVLFCDIPEEKGGTDLGPMPPELLLAALANCFGMVAALHCKERGLPYEGMSVTVSADKAKDEEGQEYWTNIKVVAEMPPGFDEARLEAILRHARRACSVGATIERAQQLEECVVCKE